MTDEALYFTASILLYSTGHFIGGTVLMIFALSEVCESIAKKRTKP